MLLQVAFVMLCLTVMTQISRHWYTLSQHLIADAHATQLRHNINWKTPRRR